MRTTRQVLWIITLAFGFVAALYVLYISKTIVLLALLGIGLGILMAPVVSWMQHKSRLPRGIGAALMALLILGGIFGVGFGLVNLTWEQLSSLISQSPRVAARINEEFVRALRHFPWLEEQVRKVNVGGAVGSVAQVLLQGVQTGLSSIAGLVIILTLAIYTAVNSMRYFEGFLSLFPAYQRPLAADVCSSSAWALRRWFRSQLIVVAITGVTVTVALWALGIDYWLVLGVLWAALDFIPYLGPILAGALSALVTLGTEPDKIWRVVGLFLVQQQLEGNMTFPLVMRGSVQLPEIHLLILMMLMGNLFGIVGIFMAPAVLTVARTFYLKVYVSRMDAELSPPPEPEALKAASRESNRPAA